MCTIIIIIIIIIIIHHEETLFSVIFFQPTEIFSDHVSSESSKHSADSIETIARSLSRNIHSSEVIDSRRVRQDSFNVLGLDESDSVFSSGKDH